MEITRSSIETMKGPADWFTGEVYLDVMAANPDPSRVQAANVHFTPGARVGRVQREGGEVEEVRPGDRVHFEPGENHWHGAAPDRFMAHIAIQEADDSGSPVSWGRHVTGD